MRIPGGDHAGSPGFLSDVKAKYPIHCGNKSFSGGVSCGEHGVRGPGDPSVRCGKTEYKTGVAYPSGNEGQTECSMKGQA